MQCSHSIYFTFLLFPLFFSSTSTERKRNKMLINGQKYSCEACIRGHRVTTCKHHGPSSLSLFQYLSSQNVPLRTAIYTQGLIDKVADRPLTKINRKGRPFSTCSICHRTPCAVPDEHARIRREVESKSHHHHKVCFRLRGDIYMGMRMGLRAAETEWEVYKAVSGVFADCPEAAGCEVGVVDCDAVADAVCSGC